ncbi:MAG: polyribonucleotide nucleotidyltransferase [Actinomycetota bacterium]|nr:polyribonucleotide nucleotidyltransferase [Actinomycetota bacterium]
MPETLVRGRVGGREFTLSTGKLAMQANGAVVARIGDTEILVTATADENVREGIDFFPLTVDVEERMYAAGKIPGSFFRREGRPTERATLTARLIDRPLRPSFADGFRSETQVIATILSVDLENPYDVTAINGASAALTISDIPFQGPLGAVRLAYRDGRWNPMPTFKELEESVFDLVVAGRRNEAGEIDIMMVEAGSTEDGLRLVRQGQPASDEAAVAQGLEEAKQYIAEAIDLQLELRSQVEVPEHEWPRVEDYSPDLYARVDQLARPKLAEVIVIPGKKERSQGEDEVEQWVLEQLEPLEPGEASAVGRALKSLRKTMMRERVVKEGVRLDGRGPGDLRSLSCSVGLVPRAHGSGLFERGETQVLNVTTLGMLRMEQLLDTISIEETKRYMHHYNFPPFSTGETGFMRGPRRREIGHGALAERAVLPVVPSPEDFPYALRLVSEVLSSNGSTSMASVCASTLSLMDAGVPILEPVGGIAMGLIALDGEFVTLTDILGAEDALGDMDFKVAGTSEVITALQLDTKAEGLSSEVVSRALEQAREARLKVLEAMREAIEKPREELSAWAPRIEAVSIPRDKIGEVIGPKGKNIRKIEEETEAQLDIEDDGTIRIGAPDWDALRAAKKIVLDIAFPPDVEIGQEYDGEVVNITKFGAFVSLVPGRDGLLHISKIGGSRRIDKVEDVLSLGDSVKVVVRDIDQQGKVSLDMAQAPGEAEDQQPEAGDGERPGQGRRPRRERGGSPDRGGKPKRKQVSFEEEFQRGL